MSRLMKVLFILGTSVFLFQFAGCFQKAAIDGGISVFPLPQLFGTGGLIPLGT
jgi:hypothetical protein